MIFVVLNCKILEPYHFYCYLKKKKHQNSDSSHVFISSPNPSPALYVVIPDCLLNTSSWISNGIWNQTYSELNSQSFPQILFFPQSYSTKGNPSSTLPLIFPNPRSNLSANRLPSKYTQNPTTSQPPLGIPVSLYISTVDNWSQMVPLKHYIRSYHTSTENSPMTASHSK